MSCFWSLTTFINIRICSSSRSLARCRCSNLKKKHKNQTILTNNFHQNRMDKLGRYFSIFEYTLGYRCWFSVRTLENTQIKKKLDIFCEHNFSIFFFANTLFYKLLTLVQRSWCFRRNSSNCGGLILIFPFNDSVQISRTIARK